jgi:predicted dienelactone hydrolase
LNLPKTRWNGFKSLPWQLGAVVGGMVTCVGIAIVTAAPSWAAERLILRAGPFSQTVTVSDVEHFAKTGEISPALQFYAPLLKPEVRRFLNKRVQLDADVGEKALGQVLRSPSGKKLWQSLQRVSPGLTIEQLQAGLWLAARQFNGLDAIGVLRSIPKETLTIDVTEAISVASQVNVPYLKTQALGPLLAQELQVDGSPVQAAFDPTAVGDQPVQQQSLILSDPQRRRTLPVDLYWAERSQGPLVVISPGLEADRTGLAYLARHLASHGFTVAVIEHPTFAQFSALPTRPEQVLPASEFVDRPQDIRFLLNQFAEQNRQPGALQGKLNTEQVSVIGHSLGGYTALALAGGELDLEAVRQFCQKPNVLKQAPADWLQCAAKDLPGKRMNLRDRRVVQAIALNPMVGRLFGETGLQQVATPTLVLAATEDALTPMLSHQLQPFNQLPSPKYLLTAIGATHLSIADPNSPSGSSAIGKLTQERRGQEVAALRQLFQGVALAFLQQQTPAAETYRPFLSSTYAQSFSTPNVGLRLNDRLPESLNLWLDVAARL